MLAFQKCCAGWKGTMQIEANERALKSVYSCQSGRGSCHRLRLHIVYLYQVLQVKTFPHKRETKSLGPSALTSLAPHIGPAPKSKGTKVE